MPTNPLGPTGLLAQSMTLPTGSQSMAMGGMGLRAQGMDGRKKSGVSFSSSVTYVNSGNGSFAGSTFVFTATSTQADDWMVIVADGVNATSVTGGTGAAWTKLTLTNVGGVVTTIFYRRLESGGDAGAVFVINGGTNAGPAEWVAYRGVASVDAPQTQVSLANAPDLRFSEVSPANKSGRLLAIASQHNAGAGSWTAPSGWNARVSWNAIGPKYLGDILSQTYASQGGPIVLQTSVTSAGGQVGWLFELIGT